MDNRISPAILDEAADWLMRLNGGLSAEEQKALQHWRTRSPAHAQAWLRAERLQHKLGGLPPGISMPVLNRPADPKRRAAIKHMLVAMATIPAGWAAVEVAGQAGWGADFRTATGERQRYTLADGSTLTLNTGSAVDVVFDDRQRRLVLRQGEILIDTVKDAHVPARVFLVDTPEGRLQALGTRFDVRWEAGRTKVAVFEGAVRLMPQSGSAATLAAGEQGVMTPSFVTDRRAADLAATAWTQGMLVADGMPLAEFAQEMTRYRSGILRVDPSVAGMKISGAFPLDRPQDVMRMLATTYPLEIRSTMLGYVTTLVPRP